MFKKLKEDNLKIEELQNRITTLKDDVCSLKNEYMYKPVAEIYVDGDIVKQWVSVCRKEILDFFDGNYKIKIFGESERWVSKNEIVYFRDFDPHIDKINKEKIRIENQFKTNKK